MLRTNLGCFGVVVLAVLMFFPFVTNTVSLGCVVWHVVHVVNDAYPLTQCACRGISARLMTNETGRMSPPGLHWRVHADESVGNDRDI
jgi:hypothetical protein